MDITVYLPDDLARLGKQHQINFSGVLRRSLRDELEVLSGFEDRFVVLQARWVELSSAIDVAADEEAKDAVIETGFKLLRGLYKLGKEVPATSVELHVRIGALRVVVEGALVG